MFTYSPGNVDAVTIAFSAERLGPYMAAANGNKERALRRYERNIQLSEALYGPLQAVEVCIRNCFNSQLAAAHGEKWYDALEHSKVLEFEQLDKLQKARAYLAKRGVPETAGRIVAELSFGFWTGICAKPYMPLWISCLSRPFKQLRISRADFWLRLDNIRFLRNRVAHYEPILNRNLAADYSEIIQTIGWVNGSAADWAASTSSFAQRFAEPLPPPPAVAEP